MPKSDSMLSRIVAEALQRTDPTDRAAYLDQVCANDSELRAQVEAMLAGTIAAGGEGSLSGEPSLINAEAKGVLTSDDLATMATGEHKAHADTGTLNADGSPHGPRGSVHRSFEAMTLGTVLAGRYTLERVIGEGGMGTVYLASQTNPVKRQVALKIIKIGMDTKAVLARFDAERQALALMDHPNIARIYDGGVTESGLPYFAMELVQGVPLTDYCDRNRLSVDARLELFSKVCQAVQHAHQKGIIHRDLKPGNVLVTEVDGSASPKVIDFGVAKAIEQKLTELSFSDVGAIVGTPAYMSPEQADPTSMDVDTRTDVYALGVMLYELLTGSPPIQATEFKRGAVLEMLRMVREDEPPRPSTRLSTSDALPNIAANRSIDPSKLTRLLQGELDWVVMKALEKDRTRRYETANGLARDLQRYLVDEVVEARPPSRGYRLRKFLRRNRGRVLAGSLLLTSLLGGLIAVVLVQQQANHRLAEANSVIREERNEAERQRSLAEEAQRKAEANLQTARKQAQLAMTTMQFIVTDVNTLLEKQPGTADVRISLMKAIEKKWDELDLAMVGGEEGQAIPTLMAVRYQLAQAWESLDRLTEADTQYRKLATTAESRVVLKNRSDSSRLNLARIDVSWARLKARTEGGASEAGKLMQKAKELTQEIRRDPRPESGSPNRFEVADVQQQATLALANAAVKSGDRATAEAEYAEVERICTEVLDDIAAKTRWFEQLDPTRQNVIRRYFTQSLELGRSGRANCLCALGKVEEAIAIYRAVIERSRADQAKVPNDPNARDQLALQLRNFGQHMMRINRLDEANTALTEAVALTETNYKLDPTAVTRKNPYQYSLYYAGVARDAQGKVEDARALFERARTIRTEMYANSANKANKVNLMLVEARLGNAREAKALADDLSRSKGRDPDLRLDVARAMAQLARQSQGMAREELIKAALDALEQCLQEGQRDRLIVAGEQDLVPLREDPRYQATVAKLANPEGSKPTR